MRTNMHCGTVPKANVALIFLAIKIFVIENFDPIKYLWLFVIAHVDQNLIVSNKITPTKSFHFDLSKSAGARFRGCPSSCAIGNQSYISTRFLYAKKKLFAGWPTCLWLPTRTTYLALIIRSISQKICHFGLPSPIHQDLNHFRRLTNNAHNASSTRSSRLCYSDGNIHPAAPCSSKQGSYAPSGQCHSASK